MKIDSKHVLENKPNIMSGGFTMGGSKKASKKLYDE
jgi:hypothetical protein